MCNTQASILRAHVKRFNSANFRLFPNLHNVLVRRSRRITVRTYTLTSNSRLLTNRTVIRLKHPQSTQLFNNKFRRLPPLFIDASYLPFNSKAINLPKGRLVSTSLHNRVSHLFIVTNFNRDLRRHRPNSQLQLLTRSRRFHSSLLHITRCNISTRSPTIKGLRFITILRSRNLSNIPTCK